MQQSEQDIPVIEMRDLSAGYEGEAILEGVQLRVARGEFMGIIGPNGGGKTTLLKVILGLLRPMRGKVLLFGGPVREKRSRIGYVPQVLEFDRQFPVKARDVVRMGRLGRRRVGRGYGREDEAAVDRALAQIDCREMADELFGNLSGGQRQLVLIARALAVEPDLLLLDEPTSSIDPRLQGGIYDLLAELNDRVTIVLVTHDVGVISAHVKTVGCLNRTFHYHGDSHIPEGVLQETYGCPVDLIAHGTPHRVFPEH